ncbi:hypothetical protein [Roseofilum capinflatum]|uniref:Cell division protein FtsL n=1 Tax=Roseofilum capinflatum BLCC-M114 TaxID=3022440 RepID=A0ABT7BB94_9CYAN|nr:hypothetical protein [Roseofilum capinflatum]MDJ1175791.1 hypothetical protein [Roseofilum capinflatum BLCC-M114]
MVALKSFPHSSPRPQRPRLHNPNRSRLRLVSSQPSQPPATTGRDSSAIAAPPINKTQRPASGRVSPAPRSIPEPAQVKRLDPERNRLPKSVIALQAIEKLVFVCTLGLGAATLGIYSLMVQNQQEWMAKYNHLQNLQRYERQLVTASEILKNRMASQAETSDTGLVPQNPETTIFLDPVEQRPHSTGSQLPVNVAPEPLSSTPLGY